jgi:hypothetical protein
MIVQASKLELFLLTITDVQKCSTNVKLTLL